jgi:hypothetical protein
MGTYDISTFVRENGRLLGGTLPMRPPPTPIAMRMIQSKAYEAISSADMRRCFG